MAIYTKRGDKGNTNLFDGKKVLKSDLRLEVIGSLDELNTCIGVARSLLGRKSGLKKVDKLLKNIQKKLFEVGSEIAKSPKFKVKAKGVESLESSIDEYEASLAPLTKFILPSGSKQSTNLHHCRTICRRAERRLVELSKKESINPKLIKYLNRLSDLLFVLARFVNKKTSGKEEYWKNSS